MEVDSIRLVLHRVDHGLSNTSQSVDSSEGANSRCPTADHWVVLIRQWPKPCVSRDRQRAAEDERTRRGDTAKQCGRGNADADHARDGITRKAATRMRQCDGTDRKRTVVGHGPNQVALPAQGIVRSHRAAVGERARRSVERGIVVAPAGRRQDQRTVVRERSSCRPDSVGGAIRLKIEGLIAADQPSYRASTASSDDGAGTNGSFFNSSPMSDSSLGSNSGSIGF